MATRLGYFYDKENQAYEYKSNYKLFGKFVLNGGAWVTSEQINRRFGVDLEEDLRKKEIEGRTYYFVNRKTLDGMIGDEITLSLEDPYDYLQIQKLPVLERREELRLARVAKSLRKQLSRIDQTESQYRQLEDMYRRVKDKLVLHNLGLVRKFAKKYCRYGVEFSDLFQEGIFGLFRAVKDFDPERGNKFSTYAIWWIKQTIRNAIRMQARTVRPSTHIIEIKRKIHKAREKLMQKLEREPNIKEICKETKLLYSTVKAAETRKEKTFPLDENLCVKSREGGAVIDEKVTSTLEKLLGYLEPREAGILRSRYRVGERYIPAEEKRTLKQLDIVGREFGLCRERIRQVEEIALKKLQFVARTKRVECPIT